MEVMLQVLDELDDAVATLRLVWPRLAVLALIAAACGTSILLL